MNTHHVIWLAAVMAMVGSITIVVSVAAKRHIERLFINVMAMHLVRLIAGGTTPLFEDIKSAYKEETGGGDLKHHEAREISQHFDKMARTMPGLSVPKAQKAIRDFNDSIPSVAQGDPEYGCTAMILFPHVFGMFGLLSAMKSNSPSWTETVMSSLATILPSLGFLAIGTMTVRAYFRATSRTRMLSIELDEIRRDQLVPPNA